MKSLTHLLLLAALFVAPLGVAQPVLSQSADDDTQGIVCQFIPGNDCARADEGTAMRIVETIIDILFLLIGAISVLVVIIAGFMYVLSAGNPDSTKRAKNAIIYAMVGLAVAFFARTIVMFILSSV